MMEKVKEAFLKNKINIRYLVHMLLTLVFAAGIAFFSNVVILENAWNDRYFLFAGVIFLVIVLCSFIERKKIYNTVRTPGVLTACFLVSGLLLLLSDFYVNLPIWLLGGIVAAALVSRNIGMLYLYFFVFHAIYLQGNWLNGLVFHFVVATIIAFLIPKMKTFLSMFYMMAFAACLVITGSVIHNKMVIENEMMLDTFYILCTYLACILITMLLVKWTGERGLVKKEEEEPAPENNYSYLDLVAEDSAQKDAEIDAVLANSVLWKEEIVSAEESKETVSEEIVEEEKIEEAAEETLTEIPEEIDYTPYCDEKAELLLELRAKNKSAYAQAVLVGKLASETAKSIGLNAELTKAGGLYKRIGKIREQNDEYTSTEVAKEHGFPQPLVYLLDQLNHNIIEQKEAALLLITDGVISYYSIVRHVQKTDIPVEKIVDTIVSKKIFQGEFNESGLSMQECFLLREKLIALLKNQDKKQSAK